MTLDGLKGTYSRLRDEIDSLGRAGDPTESKLTRLMCELDQVDRDLATYRRLARTAPMLLDEVAPPEPVRQRSNGRERHQAR